MKKFFFLVIFLLLLTCMFTACDKGENVCDHEWITNQVAPTCTAVGYETITCKLCGKSEKTTEIPQSGHEYSAVYSFDDADHWLVCRGCGIEKDKAKHTLDGEGVCSVCQITPGVVYGVSDDGTFAMVMGYIGTATKVMIAKEFNGLPVTNIADSAFHNNQIITSVVIPDTVTRIDSYAFAACHALASAVIPDSVTTMGYGIFSTCKALTSVVIGDGVKSIGSSCFLSCFNLASVEIGDGVTVIAENAFRNCKSLVSVVLPAGLEEIHHQAFYNCPLLESVVIPDSVALIATEAFNKCDHLTHVYYTGSREDWGKIKFYENVFNRNISTIYYDYVPTE